MKLLLLIIFRSPQSKHFSSYIFHPTQNIYCKITSLKLNQAHLPSVFRSRICIYSRIISFRRLRQMYIEWWSSSLLHILLSIETIQQWELHLESNKGKQTSFQRIESRFTDIVWLVITECFFRSKELQAWYSTTWYMCSDYLFKFYHRSWRYSDCNHNWGMLRAKITSFRFVREYFKFKMWNKWEQLHDRFFWRFYWVSKIVSFPYNREFRL